MVTSGKSQHPAVGSTDTEGLVPGTALLWGAASPDEITGVQLPVQGLYQALGGLGSQSPWNEKC